MARVQCKNIINKRQNNMAQTECISHTTSSLGYANTAESKENGSKSNPIKTTEVFKEEISKTFKGTQKKAIKQVKEVDETV